MIRCPSPVTILPLFTYSHLSLFPSRSLTVSVVWNFLDKSIECGFMVNKRNKELGLSNNALEEAQRGRRGSETCREKGTIHTPTIDAN